MRPRLPRFGTPSLPLLAFDALPSLLYPTLFTVSSFSLFRPLSAVQSDHARVWDWRSQGFGLLCISYVAIGASHHLKCICKDLRVICFRRVFILEVDFWSSGFGIDARRGFGVLCNVAIGSIPLGGMHSKDS